MSPRSMKRKCKNCQEYFVADPRNRDRQKFCKKPQCRMASKADSQRRWLEKPENIGYFRGQHNVERVRDWRKNHPGYWRRNQPKDPHALQDACQQDALSNQKVATTLAQDALQDSWMTQPAVIIGLIASLTGSALQDDIDSSLRRMEQLGRDIMNPHPPWWRKRP